LLVTLSQFSLAELSLSGGILVTKDPIIELMITPRSKDLGGFSVRRILPFMKKRTVGPFIFLDHAGPAVVSATSGIDVRPHPHIGLSTVTYLFEGVAFHRDSLGSAQEIRPGAINWMTAGRGIVHSERTPTEVRRQGGLIHGLQSWVALPHAHEETEPEFFHYAKTTVPEFSELGVPLRLLVGTCFGHKSPVKVYSDMFYLEIKWKKGQRFTIDGRTREVAVYPITGDVRVAGEHVSAGTMAVARVGHEIEVEALTDLHAVCLGGEPLDGPREIWWNFVSSSKERIERAKTEWREHQFPPVPGDEKDFIPLPDA
jgi:redox-sensitive bicupin YhaK (pirin superfamily)